MKIPKPTRWQYYLADGRWGWLIELVAVTGSVATGAWCYVEAQDPNATYDVWVFLAVVLPAVAASWIAIRLCLAILVQKLLWATFPHMAAEIHEGDHVLVLTSKHRDKVLRVYSTWQHNSFRVDLGPEAKDCHEDILYPRHVLRVEPDDAPASNDVASTPPPG